MDATVTYDQAAEGWSRTAFRRGYVKAYRGFLAGSVLPSGPVLDVGTGPGVFALCWLDEGGSPDLTLLDPSLAMLNEARMSFCQRGLCPTLVHSDFESFESGARYDAVLASHVLEHFDDPVAIMQRFSGLLSPGGRLYLSVSKPHWCNWLIWLRFRHRWYEPEQVSAMGSAAGLVPMRVHDFHCGSASRTSLGYIFSKPV